MAISNLLEPLIIKGGNKTIREVIELGGYKYFDKELEKQLFLNSLIEFKEKNIVLVKFMKASLFEMRRIILENSLEIASVEDALFFGVEYPDLYKQNTVIFFVKEDIRCRENKKSALAFCTDSQEQKNKMAFLYKKDERLFVRDYFLFAFLKK
ncbi:hypothetical protein KKC67_00815 [Patescibacteria group bacterium]|nr:hypothetical protein [Patescibacteria group bacterium]MBU2250598.1 hypothetical protein [Patescibacteria group bacterium]